jgi:hypothetical protein
MAGILEALGFERTDSMKESDIYIVNTCSVRQKSEDKAYGIGKELKELTDDGKETPFVVMAGCMVGSVTGERQRYAFEELKKRTPWVQEYINPHQIMNLPEILFKNGYGVIHGGYAGGAMQAVSDTAQKIINSLLALTLIGIAGLCLMENFKTLYTSFGYEMPSLSCGML